MTRPHMNQWLLKRTRQCAKCPWRKDVDPNTIPDGYCVQKHKKLSRTINSGIASLGNNFAMACHESPEGDEAHCIGWLVNQLGPGNNLWLRIRMLNCRNLNQVKTVGPQHETLEDTIPE